MSVSKTQVEQNLKQINLIDSISSIFVLKTEETDLKHTLRHYD